MSKIQRVILPIEENNNLSYPHNNDILLYDANKRVWYQTTKEDLLKAERFEIKRQAETIVDFEEKTNKEIENMKSQIIVMKNTISQTIELLEPYIKSTTSN